MWVELVVNLKMFALDLVQRIHAIRMKNTYQEAVIQEAVIQDTETLIPEAVILDTGTPIPEAVTQDTETRIQEVVTQDIETMIQDQAREEAIETVSQEVIETVTREEEDTKIRGIEITSLPIGTPTSQDREEEGSTPETWIMVVTTFEHSFTPLKLLKLVSELT